MQKNAHLCLYLYLWEFLSKLNVLLRKSWFSISGKLCSHSKTRRWECLGRWKGQNTSESASSTAAQNRPALVTFHRTALHSTCTVHPAQGKLVPPAVLIDAPGKHEVLPPKFTVGCCRRDAGRWQRHVRDRTLRPVPTKDSRTY